MKKKDILFGRNSIIEALKNGINIDHIIISQTATEMGEIMKLAKEQDIPFKRVHIKKLEYILFPMYPERHVAHQGIIAVLNEFEYVKLDDIYHQKITNGEQPVFVLLDRITDVGNFGAIARSALCFDIDAIIIPNKNSVSVNAMSNKASAGALSQIPICRVENIWDSIDYLVQCGFQIVGASEKGTKTIDQIDSSLPTLLILGSENSGISLPLQKMLNEHIKINMNFDKFDSLNVSVSAGILFSKLYESRMRLK